MATLSKLIVYPIKSLDGVAVQSAKIMPGGSLEHDREFCLTDQSGTWINGKRTAKIHLIRSSFDLENRTVTVSVQGENAATFHLDKARDRLEKWLSDYFGFAVFMQQNLVTGFPDDPASPGPTLISTGTLETLAAWFPGVSVESMRSRLRTNLELNRVPAFWEDRLFSASADPVFFELGAVEIQGINPCARCVVPTRDANSGEAYTKFQKTFIEQRKAELPDWAPENRFDHYYRAAVNTRIAANQAGKVLQIGDTIVQR